MLGPAGQVLAGYLVDGVVGDPAWLPHPVVAMGRAIRWLEGRLLRPAAAPAAQRLAGGLVVAAVVAGAWLGAAGLVALAAWLHPALGWAVSTGLVATALARKSLAQHAAGVLEPLAAGRLSEARERLAMIVGRDTSELDAGEVARGAVESVAENTSDGVVAPLLYGLVGGAPLALAYKAVNTLDSMLGYRHPPYTHFGWAAARLDDLANWIPARLTAGCSALASAVTGLDWRRALATALGDGRKHPSPNAGYPEAAFAGALGLRLGGANTYHGRVSVRPVIGASGRLPGAPDVNRAVRLMHATSHTALVLGLGLRLAVAWVVNR